MHKLIVIGYTLSQLEINVNLKLYVTHDMNLLTGLKSCVYIINIDFFLSTTYNVFEVQSFGEYF